MLGGAAGDGPGRGALAQSTGVWLLQVLVSAAQMYVLFGLYIVFSFLPCATS